MFNLFVVFDRDAWEGEPYTLPLERFAEYTQSELKERFSGLTPEVIRSLCRLPCVFAYETGIEQDPKFGRITDVEVRRDKIQIHYEIENVTPFLTYTDINRMSFELDLSGWEMSRTHWAIKDVNLPLTLATRGINLPGWAAARRSLVDIKNHVFDVSLSFPGEVRPYVEQVAKSLERELGPNTYFYDNNYQSQLARPNLDTLLQDIYRNRSRLVVVFLCAAYGDKDWCGVEFRAIKDIIKSKLDMVMFVRNDNGKVEGVFNTDGYIDATRFTPEQVAGMIVERVELLQ
jgi:TIR domain